jgi:rhodanese-related sulfurtransferase
MGVQAFDVNIGRTGLTERDALAQGIDVMSGLTVAFDCAHYYPMHDRVTLKLVVERGTGRLLGAQGVGPGEVLKRIDVLATGLSFGATLDDLAALDLAYAPPFAEAMDAAIRAANLARNKLSEVAQTARWVDLERRLVDGERIVVLDVRTAEEADAVPLSVDGCPVLNIPLGELRSRLDEIPADDVVVAVCELGVRSYEAQRILAGAGIRNAVFLEGGRDMLDVELD